MAQQSAGKTRVRRGRRYQKVTDELRNRLKEGDWGPGTKLPTLRDLGDSFRVSTSTVRHALRVLEKEGRLQHIPAVGTFVRPATFHQANTSQLVVGLTTIEIASPFEVGVTTGVEQACRSRGWQLQVYDDQCAPELELDNLTRLPKAGVQGAVIIPTCHGDTIEALFKLKLDGFPFVLVDHGVKGLKVDTIESDHEKGAYLAVDHLVRSGHRRVLILTTPPTWSSVDARIRGYDRALLDHKITPMPEWKVWYESDIGRPHIEERRPWLRPYEAIVPVLRAMGPPLALFAINGYAGWGALEGCCETGLRVPEDVSIVCFDDSEITRVMYPPMTTVAQQPAELGRRAIEVLERRIRDRGADVQQVVLDVELIERKSVVPPA